MWYCYQCSQWVAPGVPHNHIYWNYPIQPSYPQWVYWGTDRQSEILDELKAIRKALENK